MAQAAPSNPSDRAVRRKVEPLRSSLHPPSFIKPPSLCLQLGVYARIKFVKRASSGACIYTVMGHYARAARTIAQECSCTRIRQASRVLTRIYDEHLKPTGLQDSQLSVLVGVAMFGEAGASIGSLAQALVLDRTTLTRNVGPLSKAGYLKIARSRSDGRSRVITLTRSGERLIEHAFPLWQQA